VFYMAKNITKEVLVNTIASSADISKKAAGAALEAFTDKVTQELRKGHKITLTGFGTFKVSKRKARQGRNPRTGESIKIPARKVPKFSAGKALKDAVN